MSKIIDSMTAEQELALPLYKDKWTNIGMSTAPINREKAIEAVKLAYKCAGLEPPKVIKFAKSPVDAAKILNEYSEENNSVSYYLNSVCYGNHEAYWLAFYDFFRNETEAEGLDLIEGLVEVAKNCGWVNTFDEIAVIQDRPLYYRFDENEQLHCTNGPVIEYPDGFSIYAWHGIQVPGEWITQGITASEAFQINNTELRRCAFEIIGWVNILKDLNCVEIDVDPDPTIGTLLEVDIPDVGKERFIRVLCGTGREFALPVPPDMTTALQANAWTYGLEPNEYMPEIRT